MGVRVLVVSAAVDGPQIRWSTNEKKKEMDFYEHGPYNATISDRHQRPNATRTAADIRGNNVRFPLIVRPPSHPPCRIRTMKLLLLSFFFSYAPADNPSGRQSYRPVSDACPAVRPPSDLIDFLPGPIFCLFACRQPPPLFILDVIVNGTFNLFQLNCEFVSIKL